MKFILIPIILINLYLNAVAQPDQSWLADTSGADTLYYPGFDVDSRNNVYIAGYKNNTGNGNDYITLRYDSSGTKKWASTYDGPGSGLDMALDAVSDKNGNVYVTGTSKGILSALDYATIKYDSNGTQLWATRYNGMVADSDIAKFISIDTNNNVYVTGFSGKNGIHMAVTVKYNSSGTQQWAASYNGSPGRSNIPVSLTLDDSANVYVGVRIKDSIGFYGISIVKYNSSGTKQWDVQYYDSLIHDTLVSLYNKINWRESLVFNDTGYFYVAATVGKGSDADIALIKYDRSGSKIWDVKYDGAGGGKDIVASMSIDKNEMLYLTGTSQVYKRGYDLITLKYDSSGALQWENQYDGIANDDDRGYSITIDDNGFVFVAGSTYGIDTNSNYITIKYDPWGDIIWTKEFDGANKGKDVATDVIIAPNDLIYINGLSYDADSTFHYVAINYKETPKNYFFHENTIIVSFDTSFIKLTNIDNLEYDTVSLGTYLTDSMIDLISWKLFNEPSDSGTIDTVKLARIHKSLISTDTISISRLGDTVRIPPFYADLIMAFPEYLGVNEYNACDSLNTLWPRIAWSHPNYNYFPAVAPNDNHYNNQLGLHYNTTYPDGDINVEPAWDKEEGSSSIKIAILESGFSSTHNDLGANVAANKSYINGEPSHEDLFGHGTAVAGIVGALRNNSYGVAGIAGGDVDNDSNNGISLYNLRIGGWGNLAASYPNYANVAAITEAANSNKYGVHVINISFGSAGQSTAQSNALYFAYQNQVVNVASRGNKGTNALQYPACLDDDWILNVGGAGTDGEPKTKANGKPFDLWDEYATSWGGEMDFIAPGTKATVLTTRIKSGVSESQTYDTAFPPISTDFQEFNGTSAAAPFVVGAAGLMLSYNSTLTPEDVEHILERTATHGNSYNDRRGYGLIDVEKAFKNLDLPHIVEHHQFTGGTATKVATDLRLDIFSKYPSCVPTGTYKVDKYKVVKTVTVPADPVKIIVDDWLNFSRTRGWSAGNPNSQYNWFDFSWTNSTTVKLTTYVYYIKSEWVTAKTYNRWCPNHYNNAKYHYTFLRWDSWFASRSEENDVTKHKILIQSYPNPADQNAEILLYVPNLEEISIDLIDIYGRQVKVIIDDQQIQGEFKTSISTTDLESGLYIYRVKARDELLQRKMMVIHY